MIREESRTAQDVVNYWLYLLRSKIYAQTRERLHDVDGYCCLGILIHADGGYEWYEDNEDQSFYVLDFSGKPEMGILPEEAGDKYGLNQRVTPDEVEYIMSRYAVEHLNSAHSRQTTLSTLNDNNYSFEQIADFVEEMGWDQVTQ